MFQIVAMENVAAAVAGKSDQKIGGFARTQIDGIFPSSIVGARPAAVSQNLKVDQMKMQRMTEIRGQSPNFGGV